MDTRWIGYRRATRAPRIRLFCFPYAGGSAAFYGDWAARLPEGTDVCPVQLPGRERRLAEPPYTELNSLVGDLMPALRPLLDVPFCFFGHSMGAAIGFELARELRRTGGPLPNRLFLSGRRAPQVPTRELPMHDLPDAEFLERVGDLNGTPPEVLREPEIMEVFLPLLRADIGLCERYTFAPEPALPVPFTVYGGDRDPDVSPADLHAWAEQSSRRTDVRLLPGDHFFLAKEAGSFFPAFARDIAREMPPRATWQ
jgi:medium-chain acyl-[acyl-carrier-protein] hydrolase